MIFRLWRKRFDGNFTGNTKRDSGYSVQAEMPEKEEAKEEKEAPIDTEEQSDSE